MGFETINLEFASFLVSARKLSSETRENGNGNLVIMFRDLDHGQARECYGDYIKILKDNDPLNTIKDKRNEETRIPASF